MKRSKIYTNRKNEGIKFCQMNMVAASSQWSLVFLAQRNNIQIFKINKWITHDQKTCEEHATTRTDKRGRLDDRIASNFTINKTSAPRGDRCSASYLYCHKNAGKKLICFAPKKKSLTLWLETISFVFCHLIGCRMSEGNKKGRDD